MSLGTLAIHGKINLAAHKPLQEALTRIRDCFDMFGEEEWVEWAGTDLMPGKIVEIEENRHVEEEIFAKAEEVRAEAARKAKEVRIEEEARVEAQCKVEDARAAMERRFALGQKAQKATVGSGRLSKVGEGRIGRPEPRQRKEVLTYHLVSPPLIP